MSMAMFQLKTGNRPDMAHRLWFANHLSGSPNFPSISPFQEGVTIDLAKEFTNRED